MMTTDRVAKGCGLCGVDCAGNFTTKHVAMYAHDRPHADARRHDAAADGAASPSRLRARVAVPVRARAESAEGWRPCETRARLLSDGPTISYGYMRHSDAVHTAERPRCAESGQTARQGHEYIYRLFGSAFAPRVRWSVSINKTQRRAASRNTTRKKKKLPYFIRDHRMVPSDHPP